MKEKESNLSDTIYEDRWVHKNHVKEKIQNAQRRLKEEIDRIDNASTYDKGNGIVSTKFVKEGINKIFLEEFGGKLIK